jgi:hypothetical protein
MSDAVGEIRLWSIPLDATWDGAKWAGTGGDELSIITHDGSTHWPVRLFLCFGKDISLTITEDKYSYVNREHLAEVEERMRTEYKGKPVRYLCSCVYFKLVADVGARIDGEILLPANEANDGPLPLTECGYKIDP